MTELLSADDPRLAEEGGLAQAETQIAEALRRAGRIWPADSEEFAAVQACTEQVLAYTTNHADALLRTSLAAHVTASAVVVAQGSDRLLLLEHTKLKRWLQPGGHADGQGNLAAAALREASEETGIEGLRILVPGIDIDVHAVEIGRDSEHLHLDVRFLVIAPPGAIARRNHESTGDAWVTAAELERFGADPGLRRLANAGLALAQGLAR